MSDYIIFYKFSNSYLFDTVSGLCSRITHVMDDAVNAKYDVLKRGSDDVQEYN